MCFLYQYGFWRDLRNSSISTMCRLPLVKISRFKNFVYPKGRERYNQIHGIEIITFLMFAATHMVICFHKIFFLSFHEYVVVNFSVYNCYIKLFLILYISHLYSVQYISWFFIALFSSSNNTCLQFINCTLETLNHKYYESWNH